MRTNKSLPWTEDVTTVLQKLSAGWVARYQVFSIEKDPKLIVDLQCTLDKSEVWTQIRQSLWKDGNGTVADSCRLQFPVNISDSLQRFSILRDIYTLQHSGGGRVVLHRSTIPLDFNVVIREAWSTDKGNDRPGMEASYGRPITLDSWIHRNCRLYLYWIWLSANGRYALYLDKASSKPSNLAIYDLGCADSTLDPVLVDFQSTQLYGGNREFHCDAANFHPTRSLVMVTVVGSVYLWAYKHGNVPTDS